MAGFPTGGVCEQNLLDFSATVNPCRPAGASPGVEPADVLAVVDQKPDGLGLVLTGAHESTDFLHDHVDIISHVREEVQPTDAGQGARKGTEYRGCACDRAPPSPSGSV